MTTEYLLRREMDHVLAALTPSNRLVCQVCLHTGLRVGDVLELRTQQLGKPGRHRTRQAVWADVKRAAKAFRIKQNVAPHSFRKVYAVELMRQCGDVKRVQRALNHSDYATTMIYIMAAELLEAKRRRGTSKKS